MSIEHKLHLLASVSDLVSVPDQWSTSVPLAVVAVYERGQRGIGYGYATTRVQPDGTFSLRTAVGTNRFTVSGLGYKGDRTTMPVEVDIKLENNVPISLSVRPQRGFLVHFSTKAVKEHGVFDFAREFNLHVREADGTDTMVTWGEWWFYPSSADELEIRVTRQDNEQTEVLPWTKLAAYKGGAVDGANWPRLIDLP